MNRNSESKNLKKQKAMDDLIDNFRSSNQQSMWKAKNIVFGMHKLMNSEEKNKMVELRRKISVKMIGLFCFLPINNAIFLIFTFNARRRNKILACFSFSCCYTYFYCRQTVRELFDFSQTVLNNGLIERYEDLKTKGEDVSKYL